MYLLFVLLQTAGGGSMNTMILMGLMIVVFWLFFIRPQSKKAKLQKKFTENLEKGDKAVTTTGIHGLVSKLNEDGTTIDFEIARGTNIKIEKSAVSMELTQQAYGKGDSK